MLSLHDQTSDSRFRELGPFLLFRNCFGISFQNNLFADFVKPLCWFREYLWADFEITWIEVTGRSLITKHWLASPGGSSWAKLPQNLFSGFYIFKTLWRCCIFRITSPIQGHFQTMIFETLEPVGYFRLLLSNFRRLLLACGSLMWVGSIGLHLLLKNWCIYYYIAALCSRLGYYDSWCVSYEKAKLMYKPFLWVHTLGKPWERTAMCCMVKLGKYERKKKET